MSKKTGEDQAVKNGIGYDFFQRKNRPGRAPQRPKGVKMHFLAGTMEPTRGTTKQVKEKNGKKLGERDSEGQKPTA